MLLRLFSTIQTKCNVAELTFYIYCTLVISKVGKFSFLLTLLSGFSENSLNLLIMKRFPVVLAIILQKCFEERY